MIDRHDQAMDMVSLFDEAAPPDEPHAVMSVSVQAITQGASTIYEAQIARDMKLCGFAQKKALSKASLEWQESLQTYLPKKLVGEVVNLPSASEWIHPALLAVVKKSAEQVAKKSGQPVANSASAASSSGGPVVPRGEGAASAAKVMIKKEREAEGGTQPKKKHGEKPPAPPPPAAKKRRR